MSACPDPPPPGGVSLRVLPPLSLYIHLPWCARKCPYCDFNSYEAGAVPEEQYVAALARDLEQAVPLVWGRKVRTVFFGGGTPSLFSARAIDAILGTVRALLPLDSHAEITLEANPGSAEAAKFRGFREAGVNRLSLGVQSFRGDFLQALGRIHDDREARAAVEMALRHFDNVNLDLMYGLPGQTVEAAREDVRTALAFRPPHLSAYHLTLEPNTLFYRYPPPLPEDDTCAAMQGAVEEELAARGYGHYEVSAFAENGARCRHNLNYWQYGDYLGIGAGAHSKISFPDRILRQVRQRQPRAYLEAATKGAPAQEEHEVAPGDLGFEFMMNALRLTGGFPLALFEERTGLSRATLEEPLAMAQRRGLARMEGERLAPTDLGRRFLNDLLQLWLPS